MSDEEDKLWERISSALGILQVEQPSAANAAFDAMYELKRGRGCNEATPARSEGRSFWRNGNRVGRTLYRDDKLVGVLDTPELASLVARAVNAYVGWADDDDLFCTTDDYQAMRDGLVAIMGKVEHDCEVYTLAAKALPPVRERSSEVAGNRRPEASPRPDAPKDWSPADEMYAVDCESRAHGEGWDEAVEEAAKICDACGREGDRTAKEYANETADELAARIRGLSRESATPGGERR